jgi:MFS family permease
LPNNPLEQSPSGKDPSPQHGTGGGSSRRPGALIAIFCTAQVLAQLGGLMFAALLPVLMDAWQVSHAEAGWLSGVFFGAYALSVLILLPLTDRIRSRYIYVGSMVLTLVSHLLMATVVDEFWSAFVCRVLAGIGWAGTYMVGLRALTDELDGKAASRAVSFNAAGIGLSGALSFAVAGWIGTVAGWQAAFATAAGSTAIALVIALTLFPVGRQPSPSPARNTFDFRPVFRNVTALRYSLGYCVHTWEMFVVRSWAVAFLTFVMVEHEAVPLFFLPTMVAMFMELTGTMASVAGNEVAQRIGRRRWIIMVMITAMVCALLVGISAGLGYVWAAIACLVYNAVIYADSAALTAGTVESAEPARKGATLAVHALLGYGGGFVGPVCLGLILEGMGGESVRAWSVGFAHIAFVMMAGPAALMFLGRNRQSKDPARS